MRAIIPVAGVGTRLRPHTFTTPKVLLNVAGKPIIGHILDKLVDAGFNEATIVIGYLGEMIKDYVLSHYKIKCDFIEQKEMLGLGHAIYMARNTFNNQPVLIILGDTIFDVDLKSMVANQNSKLGVKYVDDPRRFGVAEETNGLITKLVEKPDQPKSNLAIVGLYYIANSRLLSNCLETMIEKNIRTKNEYQLTDALQMMIEKGEAIKTFNVDGWYDCGKVETLLSTNQHLLKMHSIKDVVIDGKLEHPSYISKTAKIKNSIINSFSTICDNVIIENSIIKNSIINDGARITNALIQDSIIGNNAVISGSFNNLNIGDSTEINL